MSDKFDIVLFGKPRSFEAFSLVRNKKLKQKEFVEAEITPESTDDIIIKRFKNNSKHFLQMYSSAMEVGGPARIGVTVGVAFISEKKLRLDYNNYDYLKSVFNTFKKQAINDDGRFAYVSIKKCIENFDIDIRTDLYEELNIDSSQDKEEIKIALLDNPQEQLKGFKKFEENLFLVNRKEILDYKSNAQAVNFISKELLIIENGNVVKVKEEGSGSEGKSGVTGNKGGDTKNQNEEVPKLKQEVIDLKIENNSLKEKLTNAKYASWIFGALFLISLLLAGFLTYQDQLLSIFQRNNSNTEEINVAATSSSKPEVVLPAPNAGSNIKDKVCVELEKGEGLAIAIKRLNKLNNNANYGYESIMKAQGLDLIKASSLPIGYTICPPD